MPRASESTPRTSVARVRTESLDGVHWTAVLLALATGVVHVYAGLVEGRVPVALAGVGFLVALLLFLLDARRPLLYLSEVLYTGVQLPLWYVANAGEFTTLGYVDEAIQAALIVLLVSLYRHQRGASTARAESTAA